MNKSAEDWLSEGNTLYGLRKYDEAIKCYYKAIEIKPEFADAWQNKGVALYYLGKYDDAIKCYDKALELDPQNANAINGKKWCLKGKELCLFGMSLSEYKNADELLGEGIKLHRLGKYDKAIMCYDKAIEKNPEDYRAWNNKGNALNNIYKSDEALKCYDKAIEIKPENAYAWNGKGNVLYDKREKNEAIKCYDKAIEIKPEDDYAWIGKGNALSYLRKYGEALECYYKALELDPQNKDAMRGKEKCLAVINLSDDRIITSYFCRKLDPQEINIEVTSAIGYQGATILYKVKIENCTKKPIAKIRVYPNVPDVFILKEKEKSIDLIEPASSQTVTFEIRPTGEYGQCNISGRVNYYDMVSGKYSDIELEVRPLSIICPMPKRKEINEEAWRELVSGLAKAEEMPSFVFMGGESLFGMITEILKGKNLFALSPFIDKSQTIFYGNGKFYGEGIKGLKYAAQIEVQGGSKKSKLTFTAWAQKEEALTGFYHSILEQIEKRIKVKDIEDEIIQQNIQNIHYGDRIGNKFEGDVLAVRSNIGAANRKCPDCEREVKENEKFCSGCGARLN